MYPAIKIKKICAGLSVRKNDTESGASVSLERLHAKFTDVD
jgi:hypothetical protein